MMLKALLLVVVVVAMTHARLLTTEEKAAVLGRHNAIRRSVAKGEAQFANGDNMIGASDMRELVWDNDVANDAETWAQAAGDCVHDSSASLQALDEGENLAMTSQSASVSVLTGLVNLWWEELSVKPGTLTAANTWCNITNLSVGGDSIGHATALVWAKSGSLGCAVGSCSDYATWLVCRYKEAGNMRQASGIMRVYNPGTACAACAGACNDGLCTAAASGSETCEDANVDVGSQGGAPATDPPVATGTVCDHQVDGNPLNGWAASAGPDYCVCTTTQPGGGISYNAGLCSSFPEYAGN